jgi:hypothetical protein
MPNNGYISQNGYKPRIGLVTYLNKKLQFQREKQELTRAGEDLSAEKKQEGKNLDRMKVHVLNKYIFPSMADLTFFFQFIADHSELEEVFEDDVKDLLGIRRDRPEELDYGFMLYNLLWAIIMGGKREDHKQDFRLGLTYPLQRIIFRKVDQSSKDIFKTQGSRRAVLDDFRRAWAWTEMMAYGVDQYVRDETPNRIFDVRTDGTLKE